MSFLSDYEKRMLKNREENKKVLASLGLDKPFFPAQSKLTTKTGVKRKRTDGDEKPRKAQRSSADSLQTRELVQSSEEEDWRTKYGRRRSGRLMGKEPSEFKSLDVEEEDEEEEKPKKIPRNRENVFGPIPGIEVGTTWSTRLACSADGVHRPTVAGIHGNAVEGCYSLALSGGYEDDLDYGDCFTYTGEGGRDLKGTKANPKNLRTAPQSKDQTLTRGNLALTKNVEKGRPVRVIRGYKLDSPFSPEEGYRYDGLYTVEKFWQSVGLSGFIVYKFALKRCDNQAPAVWDINEDEERQSNDGGAEEVSDKDDAAMPRESPSNAGEDNRTSHESGSAKENDAEKNSLEKSSANQSAKNDIDVDTCRYESEKSSNISKQNDDNDAADGERDKVKNSTGQRTDSNGDENDAVDDNENQVSGHGADENEQSNVKTRQDDTKNEGDDGDESHMQQQDSNAQSNVKVTQDSGNDPGDDDDRNHVTTSTGLQGNSEETVKQDDGNDAADDTNVMKNASQEKQIDEGNAQVEK